MPKHASPRCCQPFLRFLSRTSRVDQIVKAAFCWMFSGPLDDKFYQIRHFIMVDLICFCTCFKQFDHEIISRCHQFSTVQRLGHLCMSGTRPPQQWNTMPWRRRQSKPNWQLLQSFFLAAKVRCSCKSVTCLFLFIYFWQKSDFFGVFLASKFVCGASGARRVRRT